MGRIIFSHFKLNKYICSLRSGLMGQLCDLLYKDLQDSNIKSYNVKRVIEYIYPEESDFWLISFVDIDDYLQTKEDYSEFKERLHKALKALPKNTSIDQETIDTADRTMQEIIDKMFYENEPTIEIGN